jgi:hypothetical protein
MHDSLWFFIALLQIEFPNCKLLFLERLMLAIFEAVKPDACEVDLIYKNARALVLRLVAGSRQEDVTEDLLTKERVQEAADAAVKEARLRRKLSEAVPPWARVDQLIEGYADEQMQRLSGGRNVSDDVVREGVAHIVNQLKLILHAIRADLRSAAEKRGVNIDDAVFWLLGILHSPAGPSILSQQGRSIRQVLKDWLWWFIRRYGRDDPDN